VYFHQAGPGHRGPEHGKELSSAVGLRPLQRMHSATQRTDFFDTCRRRSRREEATVRAATTLSCQTTAPADQLEARKFAEDRNEVVGEFEDHTSRSGWSSARGSTPCSLPLRPG
jgi:hypothetical protein